MVVSNVRLLFQPTGAPTSEAVSATNQHVYIDISPGAMTHVRTNASGTIVGGRHGDIGHASATRRNSRRHRALRGRPLAFT